MQLKAQYEQLWIKFSAIHSLRRSFTFKGGGNEEGKIEEGEYSEAAAEIAPRAL